MHNSHIEILMVDDKKENLLSLEAVLAPLGYKLIGVRSGEEALKYMLNTNIENLAAILLDVQMQGMDGFETAELIKKREKAREIPIIFITAISKSLDHVLLGYEVGSVDYILKPFHPDLLRRKVEAFVTLHRYHQQVKEQGKLLQKRAQELETINKKLVKTEALARMVSETSIDSIITCDEDGLIVSINPAVEFMFNYTSEEIVGVHIHTLIPAILERFNTGTLLEMSASRKDGTVFPVDVQLGKAMVDHEMFYVYSIRDITEKKQIEQDRIEKSNFLEKMVHERTLEIVETNHKLRKSQERFEKLFVSSPCLLAIRSLPDLNYVDVNESWTRLTGYGKEEIVGRQGSIEFIVTDETGSGAYTAGERCVNVQVKYKTKDEEVRHGLLSTEVVEIDGELCELCVITDITEKVNWEKEMVRLANLNLIGEMAAGIAHEIRNPMTAIKGFLQMYKRTQNMNTEYIDIMLEELNRANNIITEYLSLSRDKPANLNRRQLKDIVESLMPLLQADAMLAGKHIETHYEQDCPDIEVDEKEIRQLILNLGMNGLEAMESGNVLHIAVYKKSRYLVLKVQDEGKGIPPEHMDNLGKPFFTTKESGTGLGLAVCYSIATRHRAIIDVESSPKGSIFYVKFQFS